MDFLLKRGKELIAIEVKAKTQVSSQDYRGLKAINELPTVKKRIVVYLGKAIRKTEEGVDIWPFDFFCKNLEEDFESPVIYEQKKSVRLPPIKENLLLEPSKFSIHPSTNKKQWEEYKGLDWSKNKKDKG